MDSKIHAERHPGNSETTPQYTTMAEKPTRDSSSGRESHDEIVIVGDNVPPIPELSPEHIKTVMRKLDWWLIPQLTILYLLAFLDRGNSECWS